MKRLVLAAVMAAFASVAFAEDATIDGTKVRFEQIVEGLERPVVLTTSPGDERLFIAEKTGRILIVTGHQEVDVFLNLSALVIRAMPCNRLLHCPSFVSARS